jgi:hypothetical protein
MRGGAASAPPSPCPPCTGTLNPPSAHPPFNLHRYWRLYGKAPPTEASVPKACLHALRGALPSDDPNCYEAVASHTFEPVAE